MKSPLVPAYKKVLATYFPLQNALKIGYGDYTSPQAKGRIDQRISSLQAQFSSACRLYLGEKYGKAG